MGRLREDLEAVGLKVIETHISWVFLAEREVWKVKKPVQLGFLDFSTSQRRRAACDAEVRLNRRLAPEAYLGVVAITLDGESRHRFGGAGTPVDWAVHMVRMPDADRIDARLEAGRFGIDAVALIAGRLASFHEAAGCDQETARQGTVAAIGFNVRENFDQTRESISDYLNRAEAAEIEAWQTGFLADHADLFKDRVRAGRVRDGHGDLRVEHIYIDQEGRVTILDCIEFNERFRFADVCADVAFLAMDLAWRERVDLAEAFLAAYARESNDFDLYPLVDFYQSYRAYVRGKVASMLAADPGASRKARELAGAEARRYFLLALASERRSLVPPAVVAVGGIVATGKSTIADRLAVEMTAPVVSSDRTRKSLFGIKPTQSAENRPRHGAYDPEVTKKVYAEVMRRGDAVLKSGRPVVLDASFLSAEHRRAARDLAQGHGASFCFVECRAPLDICRARLRRRAHEPGVSDAREGLLDDFVARWEPVKELPDVEHVILDTSESIEANLELLRRRSVMGPAGA